MLNVKKFFRSFVTFSLFFAIVTCITGDLVSADGVETWHSGFNPCSEISIYGENTSPTKTMGSSGRLSISATFVPTDVMDNSNPVVLTLSIVDLAGRTLATKNYIYQLAVPGPIFISTPEIDVYQGQQIRVFTKAHDAYTTGKRPVNVKFSGRLF